MISNRRQRHPTHRAGHPNPQRRSQSRTALCAKRTHFGSRPLNATDGRTGFACHPRSRAAGHAGPLPYRPKSTLHPKPAYEAPRLLRRCAGTCDSCSRALLSVHVKNPGNRQGGHCRPRPSAALSQDRRGVYVSAGRTCRPGRAGAGRRGARDCRGVRRPGRHGRVRLHARARLHRRQENAP